MTERIAQLTRMTLEGKMLPKRITPEYDRCDLFLPEDTMAAKRIYEYVTAQDPIITKYSAMAEGSARGSSM